MFPSPTGQLGWWHQRPVYIGKHCKRKIKEPFGVYEWRTLKDDLPAIKEEEEEEEETKDHTEEQPPKTQ